MNSKQHIIITGASKGIGKECALLFLQKGYSVHALARSGDKLEEIRSSLSKAQAVRFHGMPLDISKVQKLKAFLNEFLKNFGPPAGVVFNAALSSDLEFADTSHKGRQDEFLTNFHSPSLMLECLLKAYDDKQGGKFIAVGSLSSITAFPGNANYAASKAALASLWRSLSLELAASEHKFGMVMPGLTDTEMASEYQTPLPRRSPKAVAQAVYENYLNPELDKTFGIENKAAVLVNRLIPRPVDKAMKALTPYLFSKD